MAANRAYLKGLGEDPSAIHKGEVKALDAKNPLVVQAAQQITQKATLVELELQVQQPMCDIYGSILTRSMNPQCGQKFS